MAALTNAGVSSGARWIGTALLHGLHQLFWPQNLRVATTVVADGAVADPRRTPKRHYPPQRDRTIENAAMRREMFRL